MTVFRAIFLLNKDISQLWYELGHKHKKYDFLKKIQFSCHNSTILSQNIYQLYNFLCVSENI